MLYKWDIVGHTQQLKMLEEDLRTGNIHHAYLFAGPRETGKARIAKTFAAILQCPNNHCRTCADCRAVAAGTHPDTIVLADDGESIKIDEVRELIRKTSLTSQGKRRVVLIESIERMPTEAQNSFLKTLEEPPGETVFLLTTNTISRVLPTIQSRTRQFYFFNTGDVTLGAFLREKFGERPDMDEVINMAQGRPGLAISLIQEPSKLAAQRLLYGRIEGFLKRNDLPQKFSLVEALEKDDAGTEAFFDAFSRYLRKLTFEYLSQQDHPLKTRFSLRELAELFESLEKTRYFIDRNVNKKLALENFLLLTEK